MKRFLTIILSAGVLLTACQRAEITGVDTTGDVSVTVLLTSPDALAATRSAALNEGSNSAIGGYTNVSMTDYDIRYLLAVYSMDGDTPEQVLSTQTAVASDASSKSFEITLSPNQSYRFVAWADFVTAGSTDDLHYCTSDLTNIYCLDGEDAQLNDESRDAYFAAEDVEITSTASVSLQLTRPFAKIRLVTKDYASDGVTVPDAVSISYYGGTRFSTLNAVTGEVTGESLAESGNTTYTASLASSKEYSSGLDAEDAYRTLAVDYLLAEDEQSTIHLSMVTSANGSEIAATDVSADIPLQRNYLTSITGSFLTTSDDDVDIDTDDNLTGDDDTTGDDNDGSDSTTVSYITDTLNINVSGVSTAHSYAYWDTVYGTSGATYYGYSNCNSSYNYTAISIRTSDAASGIITTSSPGYATEVSVEWAGTSGTLNVYGSETAYTDPVQLHDSSTQGTLIGSITYPDTVVTLTDQYPYIALRSSSGAIHFLNIYITWAVTDSEGDTEDEEDTYTGDNSFTYVSWGNNLGLTPYKDYASQYRVTSSSDMKSLSLPVVDSDIPSGAPVTFSIDDDEGLYYLASGATIDSSTGTISTSGLSGYSGSACRTNFFTVTVTVGEDDDETAVTKKFPVFIGAHSAVSDLSLTYSPFALKIDPAEGGSSLELEVSGLGDGETLALDYRRNFRFFNLNGPEEHVTGLQSTEGTFTNTLWTNYYTANGTSVNTAGRAPMSYYDNVDDLSAALGYVDNSDSYKVIINPDMFKDDYGYASGVLHATMTFTTDGSDPSSGTEVIPLAIWFDPED